jgi:signal peptidase I
VDPYGNDDPRYGPYAGDALPGGELDAELDYDDYFDDDEEEDLELEDVTSSVTRNILEWAVVLVGAVLVALLLRASLFQAFWIPSESMETTLLISDRVLVNKVSYRLHDIHRGDIVVFARPDEQPGEIRDLIKRVIGLPGDTIEARENAVYIDGNRLIEPYLDDGTVTSDFGPTVVSEGHIFVMGDNRDESYDSRIFGAVPEDRVIGRAFVLFWPLGRLSSL